MSFRITESNGGDGTNITFDGRLSGDAVAELTRVSRSASPPLTLDLSGMQFADAAGVGALREIRARGARLQNVPPYVSLLLEMNGTAPRPRANRDRNRRRAR